MKNNSGFSLVELIVVIAIMAFLAGVAVPTYSKYIAKAKDANVVAELDAVKTAAMGAAVSEGETLTSIVVASDGSITANTNGADGKADISTFYDGTTTGGVTKLRVTIDTTNSTYKSGAVWVPAANTAVDGKTYAAAGWNAK